MVPPPNPDEGFRLSISIDVGGQEQRNSRGVRGRKTSWEALALVQHRDGAKASMAEHRDGPEHLVAAAAAPMAEL